MFSFSFTTAHASSSVTWYSLKKMFRPFCMTVTYSGILCCSRFHNNAACLIS